MNLNYKKAFTLAELLICMAIIGVICACAITTIKPNDKTLRYTYSNVFHELDRAYYSSYTDGFDPFDETSSAASAKTLCKGLTSYFNYTERFCDTATTTPIKADSFTDDGVQFITHNGMKFYISPRVGNVETDGVSFHLIFVDINGNKKPNSALYVPGTEANSFRVTDPDIFAFAALPFGRVTPIGIPEYEKRYMTATVVYKNETQELSYGKFARPFYATKNEAWGTYSNITSDPPKDFCDLGEIYTCTDKIRSMIDPNSVLLKNFELPLEKFPLPPINTDTYFCHKNDTEACTIVVDKFVY